MAASGRLEGDARGSGHSRGGAHAILSISSACFECSGQYGTRRVRGYEYELWLNASEYSRLSVFGVTEGKAGLISSYCETTFYDLSLALSVGVGLGGGTPRSF